MNSDEREREINDLQHLQQQLLNTRQKKNVSVDRYLSSHSIAVICHLLSGLKTDRWPRGHLIISIQLKVYSILSVVVCLLSARVEFKLLKRSLRIYIYYISIERGTTRRSNSDREKLRKTPTAKVAVAVESYVTAAMH